MKKKIMNPQSSRLNILFTSVRRRVELLRSFHRAYAALGLQGKIIAIQRIFLAPATSV